MRIAVAYSYMCSVPYGCARGDRSISNVGNKYCSDMVFAAANGYAHGREASREEERGADDVIVVSHRSG